MTDIIATEDPCSSSSSTTSSTQQQQTKLSSGGSGNAPFGDQQQFSPSTTIQTQQPATMKSPPSSLNSGSSGPKRPRFLQKLEIAPRELQSLNQVSVVKLSSNLSASTSTTSSQKSGFNSSSVSPSVLSVASSSTTSPKSVQQQDKIAQEQQQAKQEMNLLQQPQGSPQQQQEQQEEKRTWSDSTIGSSASATTSPQVTSEGLPQFDVVQQEEQKQKQHNGPISSSLQFTASLVHPQIFLGSAMDAMNAAELIARGIFYILNVAYECDFSDSVSSETRIQKKKIDLRDSVQENIERAFEEAFAFIDEAINKGVKILVHCFVGSSRSATIVIGYLMKKLFFNKNQQQQALLCFETSKQSVIDQHQEQDRTRTLVSSPTMAIESLIGKQTAAQQQQQQSAFNFAPTTLTTTTSGAAVEEDDPFASASEFINDFDVVSTQASAASYVADQQQQQQQTQQQPPNRFSFYQSALEQVQKIRPEVLPNLAFSFALQKMDNQLLLCATA